jgi:beta-barrel assembly-enhancing protease
MKKIAITLIILSAIISSKNTYTQAYDVGIDFKKSGYIRDINYQKNKVIVDFIEEKEITTEILQIPQNSNFTNLRAGMGVSVEGEFFRKTNTSIAKKITPNKDYSRKIKIKQGRVDGIENYFAFIDGYKVKLKSGTIIKGIKEYNKNFDALNKLVLGDIVELKGYYYNDGFVYADSFCVEPDVETDDDKGVKSHLIKVHDELYQAWGNKAKRRKYYGAGFDEYVISKNDAMQEYINKVGMKLVPEYIKSKIQFVFILVDNDEFNAACYPNGLSVVHTGLFNYVKNEAQLAAVLGHEIAHALYEHSASKNKSLNNALKSKEKLYRANNIYNMVGTLIPNPSSKRSNKSGYFQVDSHTTKVLLDDLPTSIIRKKLSDYSVEKESQADRVGLNLLVKAGYDPREASSVWKNVYNDGGDSKIQKASYIDNAMIDITSTKNSEVPSIISTSISSIIATTTENNLRQSKQTHPYESVRYGELLDKVYMFWSSEDLLKKSTKGIVYKQ